MTTALLIALLGQANEPPQTPPVPVSNEPNSLREQPSVPPALVLRHVFLRQHDRNGDNLLTPDELPRGLVKRFVETDRNADGYLDAMEVLVANNRLGREARRLDQVELGAEGHLRNIDPVEKEQARRRLFAKVLRGVEAGAGALANEQERRLAGEPSGPPFDTLKRVGLAVVQAVGTIPDLPGIGAGGEPTGPPPAPTMQPSPSEPGSPTGGPPPAPRTTDSKPTAPASADLDVKGDGIPSPATIIQVLDKNSNGRLERAEAVDKLADYFGVMDQNRDGSIDLAELERGLRLAQLLGIKPSIDPRRYLPTGPSSGSLSTPPPARP